MFGRGDPNYGPTGESMEPYGNNSNQLPPTGYYNPAGVAQPPGQRNAHPQAVANIYQQHQQQLQHQHQQQLQQQAQFRQYQHIHHQQQQQHQQQLQQQHINQISPPIPGTPLGRGLPPSGYNSAASPFSFSSMQSPPSAVGSPVQPYQTTAHYPNPALSPGGNLGSPSGYPLGSPLMRQHSGMSQPSSAMHSMAHSIPSVASPIPPVAASPSSYQQPSPSRPPSTMTTAALSPPPPPHHFDRPTHPVRSAVLNGPAASSAPPVPPPVAKTPVEIPEAPIVEEPLPQYPTPEEMEEMAATVKPLIPEGLLNRVFAKAGVAFMDPKIGSLIALAGQSIVADIIKDAVAINKDMPKANDRVLTRAALEKALQDRGLKHLPPDVSTLR